MAQGALSSPAASKAARKKRQRKRAQRRSKPEHSVESPSSRPQGQHREASYLSPSGAPTPIGPPRQFQGRFVGSELSSAPVPWDPDPIARRFVGSELTSAPIPWDPDP